LSTPAGGPTKTKRKKKPKQECPERESFKRAGGTLSKRYCPKEEKRNQTFNIFTAYPDKFRRREQGEKKWLQKTTTYAGEEEATKKNKKENTAGGK